MLTDYACMLSFLNLLEWSCGFFGRFPMNERSLYPPGRAAASLEMIADPAGAAGQVNAISNPSVRALA